MNNTLRNRLRHHVTGAIERGEAQAIVEIPTLHSGNLANARLIAAAPDLLQVAKDYVLLCQLHGMEGAVLDSALSAIAKAEGRAK